ncbi:MAG: phytanoyl-CoA dioxygenase family protein [Planctomycetes bacterium]|nr:phytanoyl-CoA dioxygenase family protein [Planctomycetota bacterium]
MDAVANELDHRYDLADASIAAYRRDGFVHLPGVLGADTLAPYRREITRFVGESTQKAEPLEQRTTYGKAFLQVSNIWESSALVKEFVLGRRLGRIAAELMGTTGVRIYHDQALYKEGGGGFTPWHTDQVYWPIVGNHTITAWIPLVPVPIEMGPLQVSVGSHRCAFGRDLTIGDESERVLARTLKDLPIHERAFALGDVSFHSGWTFHRAGPNRSDTTREVMTIIFMDEDAVVAAPKNGAQQSDLQRWMPGRKPGDHAASALNPLVYSSRS